MVPANRAVTMQRLVGAVLVLALLSGCQPSMEEVVAQNRPAVEGVFGQIKALDAAVRATPPVTEETMAAGGARVALDGEASNAIFIHADDIAAPETASSKHTGATLAGYTEGCGEALRGRFGGVPAGADSFMQTCGRAEYVFVLRTLVEELPELIDDDSFRPGKYEGDVLLFRLADGTLLGGFRVTGASSDQVMAVTNAEGKALHVVDRLAGDLSSDVFVKIQAKLRSHVPGVIDGPPPG